MENGIQNTPDISSVLNGLLSNPSALSSLMSLLGSVTNNQSKNPSAQSEDAPVFSHTDTPVSHTPEAPSFNLPSAEALGRLLPQKAPVCTNESRERALLLALRPFLSKNKCDTLDIFIRLLDIISLVGRIK